MVKRAMNRRPQEADCRGRQGKGPDCKDTKCAFHMHQRFCGGEYIKVVYLCADLCVVAASLLTQWPCCLTHHAVWACGLCEAGRCNMVLVVCGVRHVQAAMLESLTVLEHAHGVHVNLMHQVCRPDIASAMWGCYAVLEPLQSLIIQCYTDCRARRLQQEGQRQTTQGSFCRWNSLASKARQDQQHSRPRCSTEQQTHASHHRLLQQHTT